MNQFEKDLKLAKKRGKSLEKIWKVIDTLSKEEPLAEKHRPHRLSGKWSTAYECHIEPDWLLIYRIEEGTPELARTGTHSDLFWCYLEVGGKEGPFWDQTHFQETVKGPVGEPITNFLT